MNSISRNKRIAIATLSMVLVSCAPELERRPSLIDAPRVIAIVTTPAESAPEEEVRYLPICASPGGTVSEPDIAWAICNTPKAPTESRAVSPACLGNGAVPLGSAGELTTPTPKDACFLFGPDTPPGDFRPRDPDQTGGYYLPVRAAFEGVLSFAMQRILCNLANAPVDVSLAYAERYLPNQNPTITELALPPAIAPGATVNLVLSWPEESAERYPVYDAAARSLVERREALRVSWFASAGSFAHDVTGRSGSEAELFTENAWTAPEVLGEVHFWAVLRDERGGTAVATVTR